MCSPIKYTQWNQACRTWGWGTILEKKCSGLGNPCTVFSSEQCSYFKCISLCFILTLILIVCWYIIALHQFSSLNISLKALGHFKYNFPYWKLTFSTSFEAGILEYFPSHELTLIIHKYLESELWASLSSL